MELKRLLPAVGWTIISLLTVLMLAKGFLHRPHVDMQAVVPDVTFNFPVHLGFLKMDDRQHLIVTEKAGRIQWVFPDSTKIEGTILDISEQVYSAGHEEGMLSAAFDPDFPTRPYLYVFYSLDKPKRSRVSRFTVDSNLHADPASELRILEVSKFKDTHNGGHLLFEKPGVLWVSVGDSEASNQVGPLMQKRQTMLGTILRIDVSAAREGQPYTIPSDNPFVHATDGSLPEIWAYGFRNPWRYSYDPVTDSLIVADVGSNQREEVNQVKKGRNYGWPVFEGELCRNVDFVSCDAVETEKPLGAFHHGISRSVTGAARYSGQIETLQGRVVFADYMRGVFSFALEGDDTIFQPRTDLFKWPTARGPNYGRTFLIASMTPGPDGELYLVNAEGTLTKLVELGWWKRIRAFLYGTLNFR